MADPKTVLESLIEEHGGVLVRQRKHKIFRFPNGVVFTVSSTPEDPRGVVNALSCFKNIFGLHAERGIPGERREKKVKKKVKKKPEEPGMERLHDIPLPTLQDKLSAVELPKEYKSRRPSKIKPPVHNSVVKPRSQPLIDPIHIHLGTEL